MQRLLEEETLVCLPFKHPRHLSQPAQVFEIPGSNHFSGYKTPLNAYRTGVEARGWIEDFDTQIDAMV